MSRKIALLIGVSNYGDRPDPLRCTAKGVKAMQVVLSDPNIGEFDEVIPLFDPDLATMQRNIASTFNQAKKDDLVLLYFTGHGIKDMTGAFYLTTAQTEIFKSGEINAGTAVEASFIQRMIGNCCAERKVVILDCCFAGAFVEGFLGMDDGSVDVAAQLGVQALGDKGDCVLTAATSTRYALEPKSEDEELSVDFIGNSEDNRNRHPSSEVFFFRLLLPTHWTFPADSSTGNCVTHKPFPSHHPRNSRPDCGIYALESDSA